MARGLGRGLGSLIPTEPTIAESGYLEIPITSIRENPLQPRASFPEESLESLAASIGQMGVLQPILVRSIGDGSYELIAGERRWRAAKKAGLERIPAVVKDPGSSEMLEQALVENLHREDLNALEEAGGYQQLIEDFGLTHDALAARLGKSRAGISNTLRLLQLPQGIQRLVVEGKLSAGHARALLGTDDRGFQEALAKRIVNQGLSVREAEEAVRARADGGREPSIVPESSDGDDRRSAGLRHPGLLELEQLLSEHLSTRVKVEMSAKKGRVLVEFSDVDDLERIYRAMVNTQ